MSCKSVNLHPGSYIREHVLKPRHLSVTAAAKLIGLSRPNLSNFLNGKISASQNMASRLEMAFGVPAKTILELQAKYDAMTDLSQTVNLENVHYSPHFLEFKANDLTNWFTQNIHARHKLAVFLRKLIHSTGSTLGQVDFPGNDDAERPGWDGFVESATETPWIPSGISGWEFGVNSDISAKANSDFKKRVEAIPDSSQKATITFVFVTPWRWPNKHKWVEKQKSKNIWKDVRAYDASDLEQWLEQSLPAQTWFANQTNHISLGVKTLERCWHEWSDVTTPSLHPSLFAKSVEIWSSKVTGYIQGKSEKPLILTADSADEALAFLYQVFSNPKNAMYTDQVLVFNEPGILGKLLIQSTSTFIPVICSQKVKEEFSPYCSKQKAILFYPRNTPTVNPDITLEPLNFEVFTNALKAMGKSSNEIASLIGATGCSPTVLRRRLSTIPDIQNPAWAKNTEIASRLIPFVFAGAWNTQYQADKQALSELSGLSYEEIEKNFLRLLQFDDSPVWSIGKNKGIISQLDSLNIVAHTVSSGDLERFFKVAKSILDEDDPTLDLPDKERRIINLNSHTREYSETLRKGISEAVVLLAVYGEMLFSKQVDINTTQKCELLIRELLTPLTLRKLKSNNNELPLYAETAPSVFLNIIEKDLNAKQPVIFGLLRPAETGNSGTCPRSRLLWALEGIAWNPRYFPRVINILGHLSQIEINDKWKNRPIESLISILNAVMPQTAASLEERLKAVTTLLNKFPTVGWKICIKQIETDKVCYPTYTPKWRSDSHGYGESFKTPESVQCFIEEVTQLVLSRPFYNVDMLCDLISNMHTLLTKDQALAWEIIDNWHKAGASDKDIAKLRECIRLNILTHPIHSKQCRASMTQHAKAIYEELLPSSTLIKHEWLFKKVHVELSADEIACPTNHKKHDQHITKLRNAALADIMQEFGIPGIFALAKSENTSYLIGTLLGSGTLADEKIEELILHWLRLKYEQKCNGHLVAGILDAMDEARREAFYANLRNKITEDEALHILLVSPYQGSTWEQVDQLPPSLCERYWGDVIPRNIIDSAEDNNESVRRLLKVGRPKTAFATVKFRLKQIAPSLLVQLLSSMINDNQNVSDNADFEGDDIQRAFHLINLNRELSIEQKATLEFDYLEVLTANSIRNGQQENFPNLEKYIEEHPELFANAISCFSSQNEQNQDSIKSHMSSGSQNLAHRGWLLLRAIHSIPGQNKITTQERRQTLSEWITTVRNCCTKPNQTDTADYFIGELLSNASVGQDEVWPNEAVRDVLENLQSEGLYRGVLVGLYNARGVYWRQEGGNLERVLAEKYHAWAEVLEFSHPFVSSILRSLANSYENEAKYQDNDAALQHRLMT